MALSPMTRTISVFEIDSHQLRRIPLRRIALLVDLYNRSNIHWTHICLDGDDQHCLDVEDDIKRILAKIEALSPTYAAGLRAAIAGYIRSPMPWLPPAEATPARPHGGEP